MIIKEIILFVASVCGSPDVVSCEVYSDTEDNNQFHMIVYTRNVIMDRNDFMTTGGKQVKIYTKFIKAD